jgi:hypothetical protein
MDQDGDRLPLPLHDGHRASRTDSGQGEHAALGVHEHRPVSQPVADLKRRVAKRPRQLTPKRVRAGLAQLDDQVGHVRLPRGDQQTRQQTARKHTQRHLVHKQRWTADIPRWQQQASRRGSGKHYAQPGSGLQRDAARPSLSAHRPNKLAAADTEQQPGQQDRSTRTPPDRRDDRHRIPDRDGSSDKPRRWPPGWVGEHQLHQGPAVQVHHVRRHPGHRRHTDLREVPHEPREAGRRHQQTGAARRPPGRSDQPAADKCPADGQIRDPVGRIAPAEPNPLGGKADHTAGQPDQAKPPRHRPQPVRAASACPDSPLLGMNPRAGVDWRRGP